MVGITIDTPEQNAALIEKLDLPFPILSDPDRSGAITAFGVADPVDERSIARPAIVVITPEGIEAHRQKARDFADRATEDEVLEQVRALGLPPATQEPPVLGRAEPGPRAMPFEHLHPYFRGARFAVVALSRRHPEISEEDAARYIAQMDRYAENVVDLFRRKRAAAEDS